MFKKSNILRIFAVSAFAVTMLSAPLISTANAGSDYRGHGHGHYKVVKKKHWGHDKHRDHYRHKHYKKKHARKHRRLRHDRQHAHGIPHRHSHQKAYKVVKYDKRPAHHRNDNRLVNEIIEALISAQLGVYR